MSLADLKKSMSSRRAQAPPESQPQESTDATTPAQMLESFEKYVSTPDSAPAGTLVMTNEQWARTAPGAFTPNDLNCPPNERPEGKLTGYRSVAQAPPNVVQEYPNFQTIWPYSPGLNISGAIDDTKQTKQDDSSLMFRTAPGAFTPVAVLLGPGGTGKTFRIRQYAEQNEDQRICLTATTGVAAINIGPGCVTVNSAFKYFNEASLRDALEHRPQFIEREISGYDLIVVDEVSMLSFGTLDLIYGFIERLNRSRRRPIKLLLSGDFCQLPPVPDKEAQGAPGRNPATPFAFKAQCWESVFQPSVIKLTKNFRQDGDERFRQALHYARIGNAGACVANLECEYATTVDYDFKGLTAYSVNKEVHAHNEKKLVELAGMPIEDAPTRWGTPHRDWKEIPEKFVIKIGAQARITANRTPNFEYVNGDIGTVLAYAPGVYARVRLHRMIDVDGGRVAPEVVVDPVTRWNPQSLAKGEEPPTTCNGREVPFRADFEDENGFMKQNAFIEWRQAYESYVAAMERAKTNWYDPKSNKWIIGGITYLPIALGWASTFHRIQGLTVDAIQIDIKDRFSSNPQMMYVALSRARKACNIRITRGDQGKLATRINAHPEVLRFV